MRSELSISRNHSIRVTGPRSQRCQREAVSRPSIRLNTPRRWSRWPHPGNGSQLDFQAPHWKPPCGGGSAGADSTVPTCRHWSVLERSWWMKFRNKAEMGMLSGQIITR